MRKLNATICLTIKGVIRMLKKLICVGFLFALVGCKAEIVETKVKNSDLKKKHLRQNGICPIFGGTECYG